ncbi:hypothetical protein Tco_0233757 [Tanacetum coccineum]
MLQRKVGEALRRKGCDDSFLRWSMLRRNPSGVLRWPDSIIIVLIPHHYQALSFGLSPCSALPYPSASSYANQSFPSKTCNRRLLVVFMCRTSSYSLFLILDRLWARQHRVFLQIKFCMCVIQELLESFIKVLFIDKITVSRTWDLIEAKHQSGSSLLHLDISCSNLHLLTVKGDEWSNFQGEIVEDETSVKGRIHWRSSKLLSDDFESESIQSGLSFMGSGFGPARPHEQRLLFHFQFFLNQTLKKIHGSTFSVDQYWVEDGVQLSNQGGGMGYLVFSYNGLSLSLTSCCLGVVLTWILSGVTLQKVPNLEGRKVGSKLSFDSSVPMVIILSSFIFFVNKLESRLSLSNFLWKFTLGRFLCREKELACLHFLVGFLCYSQATICSTWDNTRIVNGFKDAGPSLDVVFIARVIDYHFGKPFHRDKERRLLSVWVLQTGFVACFVRLSCQALVQDYTSSLTKSITVSPDGELLQVMQAPLLEAVIAWKEVG